MWSCAATPPDAGSASAYRPDETDTDTDHWSHPLLALAEIPAAGSIQTLDQPIMQHTE
jgi:hypothetical protein